MPPIMIRQPGLREAQQLADMLRNDEVLRTDLGMVSEGPSTAAEVLDDIKKWCSSRRATTYAIVVDERAVGTISISYRSEDGSKAQIGYWIGSAYRRQGIGTAAFHAVLKQATAECITVVSAIIAADNHPSRRLWEAQGGVGAPTTDGRLAYEIRL